MPYRPYIQNLLFLSDLDPIAVLTIRSSSSIQILKALHRWELTIASGVAHHVDTHPQQNTISVLCLIRSKKANSHFLIFDIAAKRRKKHKKQISGLVNSMCYNEQNSKFRLFTGPKQGLAAEKGGPLGPGKEPVRARTKRTGGGKWYMMVNCG